MISELLGQARNKLYFYLAGSLSPIRYALIERLSVEDAAPAPALRSDKRKKDLFLVKDKSMGSG